MLFWCSRWDLNPHTLGAYASETYVSTIPPLEQSVLQLIKINQKVKIRKRGILTFKNLSIPYFHMNNEIPSTDPDALGSAPETPDDVIIKSFMEANARMASSALRGRPTEADRAALRRVSGVIGVQGPQAMPPVERDNDEWRNMARERRSGPLPELNLLGRLGNRISVGRNSY